MKKWIMNYWCLIKSFKKMLWLPNPISSHKIPPFTLEGAFMESRFVKGLK